LKALINEKNKSVNATIKNILSTLEIEYDDYSEDKNLTETYSLVFVGLGVNDGYARQFLDFASKLTKLVIVILHKDSDDLRRTCILHGAYNFVDVMRIDEDLQAMLQMIIDREGSAQKYSKKLVSAMNSFLDTNEFAFKMESLAKLVCFKYKLSKDELKLVERAVQLLAVTFKVYDINKVVELFSKLDVDEHLLSVIGSKIGWQSVIVHAILHYVMDLYQMENIVDEWRIDKKQFDEVYSSVKEADERNAYIAIDYEDYENLKSVLKKHIDKQVEIEESERDLQREISSEIVFHNCMYHNGSRVFLQEQHIRIEPLDKKIILLPQQTNSYSLCCISNTWMLEKVSNFLWICY
jgi:hypothetical protein